MTSGWFVEVTPAIPCSPFVKWFRRKPNHFNEIDFAGQTLLPSQTQTSKRFLVANEIALKKLFKPANDA
jgi:hypothetical protein